MKDETKYKELLKIISAAEDVKCHKYCSNYWMGNAKYKTMAIFAFDF